MGLKRRGTGRKQVLDLSDKQDSPSRRTWTSKYQQICVEHNPQNGSEADIVPASIMSRSGNTTSNNPLSGLIANYNSDSDNEGEENDNIGDLNSKVSDFLKEIQTIVPSGSSIVVPGQPLTTPGLGPEEILNHPQPALSSAWQECYDETYGSVYYWNMQTNEVTWEKPIDQPPPPNAEPQIAPSLMPAGVQASPAPVASPAPLPVSPVPRNKPGRRANLRPTPVINKFAKGRPTSDSEDEKIEMITSFGQSSDDESDEEAVPPPAKKKKPAAEPAVEQPPIGPKLQSPSHQPELHFRPMYREVDDRGPPGMEPEFNNERLFAGAESSNSGKDADPPAAVATPDNGEDAETDEGAILSRLKTQALVLKQLGGDIPDELRELIEPPCVAEPEGATDFDKEMELMEKEFLEIAESSKKVAASNCVKPESSKPESSKPESSKAGNSKPTSFALIAGYGDDSDPEDEPAPKTVVIETAAPVVKRTFESLPTQPVKTLFPIFDGVQMAPLAVPSFETDTLTAPDSPKEFAISALRPREPTPEPPEPEVVPMIDTSMPVKAGKRKKRLDISTSAELVATAFAAKVHSVKEEVVGQEEAKAENVEGEIGGEREDASEHVPKEEIPFVEAEPSPQEKRAAEEERRKEEELRKSVEELAQLVLEKVTFLGEGKDPVSPVSIMAIKIETLVSAWHKGALLQAYLSKWLGETWEELRRLEAAAAPDGWACQWDRSHKRYYYHNKTTGETRWEYPGVDSAPPGLAGGELEMEICTTPPPPASPPPPPPATPPPPDISQPDTPPPPSPPRISTPRSYAPRQKSKGRRKKGGKSDTPDNVNMTAPCDDIPPPPSIPPPLPSAPPPLPPPPPTELPPLPPSPPPRVPTPPAQLAYGEPLPPGVDSVELPIPRPPFEGLVRGPEGGRAEEQVMGMMHPMQAYMLPTYQQPIMPSIGMGAPMMDYGNIPYMMHTHMAVPATIARPPAKKPKAAALLSALNSFYSDLATLEPSLEEAAPEPVAESAPPPPETILFEADPARGVDQLGGKKKKAKKVAAGGQVMKKKKGVSSLVAKWQQVQQDVRRDYLGDEHDSDTQ